MNTSQSRPQLTSPSQLQGIQFVTNVQPVWILVLWPAGLYMC